VEKCCDDDWSFAFPAEDRVASYAELIGVSPGSSITVHAPTDKDTVFLADFTNTTGDPVFDGTLLHGLSVQLERSPFVSPVSDPAHPAEPASDEQAPVALYL
jgi:hypothetical protein